MKIQVIKKDSFFSGISVVIAAICIIIYLAALVQAAVRCYLSLEDQKIAAEQEFNQITNIASAAGARGFMDAGFIETINNSLVSTRTLEALIITGPDGEYAFEKTKDTAITWVNNSPRFINKFGLTSHGFYRSLQIQDLRNVNISAAVWTYDSNKILKILRDTVFIIMLGFTVAFFTMLIQILIGKSGKEPSYSHNAAHNDTDNEIDTSDMFDQFDQDDDDSITSATVPKGLYSPRSSIGWEDYLKERLDSELHRCASTENDLTLFNIEFSSNMNEMQYKKAAEETASFFSSRDLLFEKGKRGILVIYPGCDIDTGIEKAQKLHKRLSEKVFNKPAPEKDLSIGLTSRAGRLLSSERMELEAKEALQRAKKDKDTPIIAFKSDPDKYRKFIASQNHRKNG